LSIFIILLLKPHKPKYMKTQKLTYALTALLLCGGLIFTSCRKKDNTDDKQPDNEQSSASDNNLAEGTGNDIVAIGSQVFENGSLTTFKTSGIAVMMTSTCAIITSASNGTMITTYTVDFGTNGCTGDDGRVRKGKLIYDLSGSTNGAKYYRNPGFKMIVTSQNYSVDGNLVTIGQKVVTNTTFAGIPQGINPGTNLTWSITSNLTIVKANNGGTVTWNCTRTKELTNTADQNCYKGQGQAIDWTKAVIKLNGNSSGVNSQGENYTASLNNLIRDFNCTPDATKPHRHPFISGTISYSPGIRPTRLVDFGSANNCDFNATVTINGVTYAITLP
jgi:hypothetical protein